MKSVKKIIMVFLLANAIAFTLTGCFQRQNIVAVINNEQISEPLYRIFLWQTQRGMESVDPNIWKLDNVGGKSPEEVAKERALNSISYHIMAEEKAQELGIELTKEDKEKVKEEAGKAFENNEVIDKKYGLKQKDYEAFYSYMKLSEKVLAAVGESYVPSEDEIEAQIEKMKEAETAPADTATIVQVLIRTKNELGSEIPADKKQEAYKKAQSVLEKALSGEDLSELANAYSEDEAVADNKGEYTFKRGTMDAALEKVVFEEAEAGKVYPEVIETENGYEIVKVIAIDKADEALRAEAVKEIGINYASNELQEMCKLAEMSVKDSYAQIQLMTADAEEAQVEN